MVALYEVEVVRNYAKISPDLGVVDGICVRVAAGTRTLNVVVLDLAGLRVVTLTVVISVTVRVDSLAAATSFYDDLVATIRLSRVVEEVRVRVEVAVEIRAYSVVVSVLDEVGFERAVVAADLIVRDRVLYATGVLEVEHYCVRAYVDLRLSLRTIVVAALNNCSCDALNDLTAVRRRDLHALRRECLYGLA